MRILLATDFSDNAATAYRAVQRLALPPGSSIRIVHAIEPVTTVAVLAPTTILTLSDAAEAEARAHVRALVDELKGSGRDAEGAVGLGRAAEVLLEECERFAPDLVVVGSRGRSAIATTLLGSVSAELVDRAPCPVLVARRDGLDRIILAEDGTASAALGAAALVELPPFAAASVTVVSVVDATPPMLYADAGASAAIVAAYAAWEESLPGLREASLGHARDRAHALHKSGVKAEFEGREGNVAGELIDAAREHDADCIVVGSRGETGLRRLVLGSVARAVLLGAPCSVLIAHPVRGRKKSGGGAQEAASARA